MRAEPIAPAASERERHALEARFNSSASPAASPAPAHGLSPLSRRAPPMPLSASRDAAARRRYPLSTVPLSPIVASSTPHTARSGHTHQQSAHLAAPNHRARHSGSSADLSDSDAGDNQPGSPDASSYAPYDQSVARGAAFRAAPSGSSPAASPRVGMRPSLNDGDLDRLDRLQMMEESRPHLEAASARFRPRATTAPRQETTRSVSEGSGSTKVAAWDGGRTSPSQFILPSGQNAGRGIPPTGLWLPDTTGLTDALASPLKSLHVQHVPVAAPQPVADPRRVEQLQQLQTTISKLREDVAQIECRSSAREAEDAARIAALQSELAGARATAQAQTSTLAPRLAFSPTRSSIGMPHTLPPSPSPPRAAGAPLDSKRAQLMADLDAADTSVSRMLDQHLRSPARSAPSARTAKLAPPQQTPLFAPSPLGRGQAHANLARPAQTVPAGPQASIAQQPEQLRIADQTAELALLRQDVLQLQRDVAELMQLKQQVADLNTQVSKLQSAAPAEPKAPARSPRLAGSQLAPSAATTSARPASSPIRPSGAVFSSPVRGASRFRASNEQSARPASEAPPSSPPSGARQEGEPVEDVSGTMLSELELSRSLDASRVGPTPPSPQQEEHVVDHSHDPKKCRSCTIARRAERKRKAEAKEAAAEARRLEAEAAATEVLVERIDSLLNSTGLEAVIAFIGSLGSEDQTRLLTLHCQLVEEYFHQREVYSTLADEVKQLGPYELRHGITAAHTADALNALTEIAARIDTLHHILPASVTAGN